MKTPSKTAGSPPRTVMKSRARGAKSPAKRPAKRADAAADPEAADAPATDADAVDPANAPAPADHDGRVRLALDSLLAKSLQRDQKTGRFLHGAVKHASMSAGLLSDLQPLKQEIVAAVRSQLAADTDDAPPTLLNLIDSYSEVSLLRRSMFQRLTSMGGPVTNKGKIRGTLAAYKTFFDAEMRAAEKLGLIRLSKTISSTPREWLQASASARDRDAAPTTEPPTADPDTDNEN